MLRRYALIVLPVMLILMGCIFNVDLVPGPQPLHESVIEGSGAAKVLLLDISGFMSYEEDSSTFGADKPSMVSRIREELKRAADDSDIAGVILRINTPGGGVAASDAIHREIKRYAKASGVPVYASIAGMGTSGGYYAASAAHKIYAQPMAITGSIGVIAVSLEFSGLMDKIGVSDKTYRSGKMKGMLSPFRPDTPEEGKVIQGIIDTMHRRFVEVVHEGRGDKLTMQQVKTLADGRPYMAEDALDKGLIDTIGYPEDAFEDLKKAQGLKKARLVAYHRPGSYRGSIYSGNNISGNTMINFPGADIYQGVRFLYLWTGR